MTDTIREALQNARDWFDQQGDAISKGAGSTWDLLQVREQRDLCDAALSAQPRSSADRQAIRMMVAAGFVTEAKANEALNIAHGFTNGELQPQPASAPVGVDYAMQERAARAWCDRTDSSFDDLPTGGKARCIVDMGYALEAALAQQPAAVDAAPTYRLLSSADEIRADDEFLGDDTVTWLPVGKEFLSAMWGEKYNPGHLQPMRRTVAARPQPHGEA